MYIEIHRQQFFGRIKMASLKSAVVAQVSNLAPGPILMISGPLAYWDVFFVGKTKLMHC